MIALESDGVDLWNLMFGDDGPCDGRRDPASTIADEKSEKITSQAIYELVERQSFRCALTGRDLTPDTASVDHRQPLARGGLHSIDNLQIVHIDVNAAKGTMTQDEFIQMCREVVAWAS